jgi:hypothetical protein
MNGPDPIRPGAPTPNENALLLDLRRAAVAGPRRAFVVALRQYVFTVAARALVEGREGRSIR